MACPSRFLHIQALALNAQVELKQLYARPITLVTALADGSTTAAAVTSPKPSR